jgi:hypothetical protein
MKCLRPCSPTPAWWSSESASTASAWAHSTKAHSISTPPQTPTQYELRRRPRKRQRQPLHLGNHRRCLETIDRHKRLCASGHIYIRSGHWHRDRNTAAGKTVSATIYSIRSLRRIIIPFRQKNLSNILDTGPLKEQYDFEVSLFEARPPLLESILRFL